MADHSFRVFLVACRGQIEIAEMPLGTVVILDLEAEARGPRDQDQAVPLLPRAALREGNGVGVGDDETEQNKQTNKMTGIVKSQSIREFYLGADSRITYSPEHRYTGGHLHVLRTKESLGGFSKQRNLHMNIPGPSHCLWEWQGLMDGWGSG